MTARAAVAVAAFVAALAPACGSVSDSMGDAAAGDAPADQSTGDAADTTTCPEMIAGCVQSLAQIQSSCGIDTDLSCVEQADPSGGYNDCFSNEVRIYWDFPGADTATLTIVGADGRVCYTIDHVTSIDDVVTDTVNDPTGKRVIAKNYRPSWDHTIYACSTGQADIPDDQFPCGHPINVLPDVQCASGICQRL